MSIKSIIATIVYRLRGMATTELLIQRGMKVGKNFQRMSGVLIDDSHCWLITLGNDVTLAPRVHILAHDASTKMWLGYTKIGKVEIGNNVFVGAGTIILPGVTIGDNVVIGAGSVVARDLPSNSVCVGNPCKRVEELQTFLEKNAQKLENGPVFDESYKLTNISETQKSEMCEQLQGREGFIK